MKYLQYMTGKNISLVFEERLQIKRINIPINGYNLEILKRHINDK